MPVHRSSCESYTCEEATRAGGVRRKGCKAKGGVRREERREGLRREGKRGGAVREGGGLAKRAGGTKSAAKLRCYGRRCGGGCVDGRLIPKARVKGARTAHVGKKPPEKRHAALAESHIGGKDD